MMPNMTADVLSAQAQPASTPRNRIEAYLDSPDTTIENPLEIMMCFARMGQRGYRIGVVNQYLTASVPFHSESAPAWWNMGKHLYGKFALNAAKVTKIWPGVDGRRHIETKAGLSAYMLQPFANEGDPFRPPIAAQRALLAQADTVFAERGGTLEVLKDLVERLPGHAVAPEWWMFPKDVAVDTVQCQYQSVEIAELEGTTLHVGGPNWNLELREVHSFAVIADGIRIQAGIRSVEQPWAWLNLDLTGLINATPWLRRQA